MKLCDCATKPNLRRVRIATVLEVRRMIPVATTFLAPPTLAPYKHLASGFLTIRALGCRKYLFVAGTDTWIDQKAARPCLSNAVTFLRYSILCSTPCTRVSCAPA